jgi:GTP-sensing pleiotropic transcriptional regulator CodY
VEGWIKLHRQFTEWEWYTDDKCFRLFIHILLKCNHKDAQWRGETINRGEMITSLGKLAEQVGMTMQTLRTTLSKLESTGEINKQSTSKLTRITVCKYNNYQEDQQTTNNQTNKPLTNDQQTTNKPLTTNKNDNNEDNGKKEKNNTIVEIYDHYATFDNLKKHRSLTKEMEKAVKKFMKETSATVEDCKKVIQRHSEIVAESSSSDYPIQVRTIQQLFGQKAYNASHLIGSEYLDDGKYGEGYKPRVQPRKETPQEMARKRQYPEPKRDISKMIL